MAKKTESRRVTNDVDGEYALCNPFDVMETHTIELTEAELEWLYEFRNYVAGTVDDDASDWNISRIVRRALAEFFDRWHDDERCRESFAACSDAEFVPSDTGGTGLKRLCIKRRVSGSEWLEQEKKKEKEAKKKRSKKSA